MYGSSAASMTLANAVTLEELPELPERLWLRLTWPMELRD